MMKLFSFFIVLIAVASAQKLDPGSCPSVTPMSGFATATYTGVWYEYGKYPNIFQIQGHCDKVTYTANADGTFAIFNQQLLFSNNAENDFYGTLVNNGGGILAEHYPSLDVPLLPQVWIPYTVLGTDYTNFAVVYSCMDFFGLYHVSSLWVYTRSKSPSAAVLTAANAVIDANGLDRTAPNPFLQTDQLLCPSGW